MGQQQILFLILGVCILGITVSAGVITAQQEASSENREVVVAELRLLASQAQAFRQRQFEERGGGGSFLPLTTLARGIEPLSPSSAKHHGDFFIKKSGSCSSMQIVGIGVVPGNDPRYPVRAMITVYPESTAVTILN